MIGVAGGFKELNENLSTEDTIYCFTRNIQNN